MSVIEIALAGHRQRLREEAVTLDHLQARWRQGDRPGLLLKVVREWLQVSQQEVADTIGVSRSAILQIERGVYKNEDVWDDSMRFLSRVAHCDPIELADGLEGAECGSK